MGAFLRDGPWFVWFTVNVSFAFGSQVEEEEVDEERQDDNYSDCEAYEWGDV